MVRKRWIKGLAFGERQIPSKILPTPVVAVCNLCQLLANQIRYAGQVSLFFKATPAALIPKMLCFGLARLRLIQLPCSKPRELSTEFRDVLDSLKKTIPVLGNIISVSKKTN